MVCYPYAHKLKLLSRLSPERLSLFLYPIPHLYIRWPVTTIITIIFGVVQAYLDSFCTGYHDLDSVAIAAHLTTESLKSGYQKVIHTICVAVTSLLVASFGQFPVQRLGSFASYGA